MGSKEQPDPRANSLPAVWDLVIEEMQQRHEEGKRRYGVPLQAHNGRKALLDAYQEALDQTVYLRQHLWEQDFPRIDTVFLDLDGVLVDFVAGALQAHGAGPGRQVPGEWKIHKWLGLSEGEFWARCQGHDFWANLAPTADMEAILIHVLEAACVTSHGPGLKPQLWLLSTPSHDPGSCSGKYAWVQRCLPGFARRLILATSKRPLARPTALLIDDSDSNVDAWRDAGGTAILYPRPWNRQHEFAGHPLAILRQHLEGLSGRLIP